MTIQFARITRIVIPTAHHYLDVDFGQLSVELAQGSHVETAPPETYDSSIGSKIEERLRCVRNFSDECGLRLDWL
jgi:hypothetical protein